MELRHLDTLLAIDEEGSFTAAADALATVQSNVSDQVRQLEAELGVPLLVRSRKGAEPTEFGTLVLERARRVHRELEAMRVDLALLQGLEAGYARLGVVGTASRWLVPGAGRRPARTRARRPAARERGCVGAAVHRAGRRRARAGRGHRTGERPAPRRRPPARGGARRAGRARRRPPGRAGAVGGVRASSRSCCRPNPTRCAPRSTRPPRPSGIVAHDAGRGRGHPAHRRPRGRRRLRVDPARDRDPAGARPRPHGHASPGSRRAGSPWSRRATRSSRSPIRPCATASRAWSRST